MAKHHEKPPFGSILFDFPTHGKQIQKDPEHHWVWWMFGESVILGQIMSKAGE